MKADHRNQQEDSVRSLKDRFNNHSKKALFRRLGKFSVYIGSLPLQVVLLCSQITSFLNSALLYHAHYSSQFQRVHQNGIFR